MSIDAQTVKKIAILSHLKIDDDKIKATEDEFNKILQWVGQLKEVDTENDVYRYCHRSRIQLC